MKVERKKLELEENTSEVVHLCNAAKIFSADYYLRYKKFQRRTSEYDKTIFPIKDSDEVDVRIQSNVYGDAPPCIFRSHEHICNCWEWVAEGGMCVHEITANENLEQAATNHNFVIHKAS